MPRSMVPAVRFSTDDIAPSDRFAGRREVLGRAVFRVEAEPISPGPFRAALMVASVTDLEDSSCRRIPGNTPSLQLLTRYLDVLEDEDALATPELQQSVVAHIRDLVALTLGASRDAAAPAQGRGLRAARFRAIKDDIARNLTDESLTVRTLAARHKLTPRHIQRLFEDSGVTFTEYLLVQRLERARQLMWDPRQAEQTITAIAFAVGFGDLSYFNRTFRRRFGATPSEIRAAARPRR